MITLFFEAPHFGFTFLAAIFSTFSLLSALKEGKLNQNIV